MANNNSLNNTSYGFTLPSLNLNFTSTAQRITGDMSNGTYANRLAFQSSTVNGATSPFILPNGASVTSSIICANSNDPTNSAFAQMQIDNTSVKLISSVFGAGVQLPMEIQIGSTTAINISTGRNVTIFNTAAGTLPLAVTATSSGGIQVNQATGGIQSLAVSQSSADTQPAIINSYKTRSGGNILAADNLGMIQFHGRETSSIIAAFIRCTAESIAASRVSGSIEVQTRSTAGTLAQRLNLTADGALVINTPAAALTALTVNGYATAGTYAQRNVATTAGGIFAGLLINNASTAAGSGSRIDLQVNGQAVLGGDPELRFYNAATQTVSIGLDTSVNQLSMSTGTLGDGGTFLTYDIATTQINLPRQCAFLAYLGSDDLNVTGNGAFYTLGAVTALTEVYDQSNNFNTNGTFTAPKSGRYHFDAAIRVFGTGGLATSYQIRFSTTGGLIIGGQGVPTLGGGFFTATCSAYINMTTADTCTLQIQLNGMVGDTADINGASSVTYFGGTLVC